MTRSAAMPWRANQASARSRKATAVLLAFARQDLGVGEPRGVVDGDVQVLPADALDAIAPVAGDAVARAGDAAELLGVDVDELARPLAFIADGRRRGLEGREAAEPEAAQHGADRGAGKPERAGDGRAGQALAPQPLDRGDAPDRQAMAASGGRRAPVVKHPLAARPMPRQPLVGAPFGDPGRLGSVPDAPAFTANARDEEGSTMDRHAGMLVDVHPGAPGEVGWRRNPSLTPQPRMNNLHSFDI
jgi:hypothetical protein